MVKTFDIIAAAVIRRQRISSWTLSRTRSRTRTGHQTLKAWGACFVYVPGGLGSCGGEAHMEQKSRLDFVCLCVGTVHFLSEDGDDGSSAWNHEAPGPKTTSAFTPA